MTLRKGGEGGQSNYSKRHSDVNLPIVLDVSPSEYNIILGPPPLPWGGGAEAPLPPISHQT